MIDPVLLSAALRWWNLAPSAGPVQRALDALDDHRLRHWVLLLAEEGLYQDDALSAAAWHERLALGALCEGLACHLQLADPRDQSLRTELVLSGAHAGLTPPLDDSDRYRGYPVDDLQDAHLDVRMAATIAAPAEDRADYAVRLLGVQPAEWTAIETNARVLATERVAGAGLAANWSDEDEAQAASELRALLPRLRAIAVPADEHATVAAPFSSHEFAALIAHAQSVLQAPAVIYLLAHDAAQLRSANPDCVALPISVDNSRSRIATSFREGIVQRVARWDATAVVDQQVMTVLASDEIVLAPICADGDLVGMLITSLPGALTASIAQHLVSWLAGELGHATAVKRNRARVQSAIATQIHARYAQQLREVVHEANNPLAIVSNYLHIVLARVGADASLREPLLCVVTEIERTAAILQGMLQAVVTADAPQLKDDAISVATPQRSNAFLHDSLNDLRHDSLNDLLIDMKRLFAGAALRNGVRLEIDDHLKTDVTIANVDVLRQILVNLVRNALEAVAVGGTVRVQYRTNVFRNARRQAVIGVIDDGPGIDDEQLRALADSKISSKGDGHSGLGLALAHRLVAQIGATLDCETSTSGTIFTLMVNLD